jgi:alkylhydroperoxidase/carboxymuconolactone decarboxylase family protein YurZ
MRSSVESGNAEEWSEAQKERFKSERETLNKRMDAFNRMMDEFETDKKRLKTSLEEEQDPELNPEFPRMVEKRIIRITNKQGELSKRRNELTKRMKELDVEEQQLNALLGHERYPEWLDLKRKRDEAVEVVAGLEAEMKRLMESIIIDTARK